MIAGGYVGSTVHSRHKEKGKLMKARSYVCLVRAHLISSSRTHPNYEMAVCWVLVASPFHQSVFTMGNKQTVFSEEQLDNYAVRFYFMFNTLASKTYLSFQDTTFLTRTEILRVFRRFCEIQEIPYKKTQMTYEDLTQIIAKYSDLCKCPELKENPFRKRICKVFSSDDSGNLTFDQFVYLFSVFSEKAPREMKVQFAFKIYGNFSKII